MAYSKTTWQNNVTDIDANNLNKIEQGIYDNSLVVDAVTNTLNPTDTETYKTVELTEGQITDVIGVKDILIKGQTSQDGEPTPTNPVEVQVVKGDVEVKLQNKNLLDKENEISQGSTNNAADTTRLSIRVKHKLKANTTYTVITNLNTGNFLWAFVLGTKVSPWSNAEQLYDTGWKNTNYWSYTTSQECYINIPIRNSSNIDININDVKDYWVMLYEGAYNSNVSYEPHQEQTLPLYLPVENLFDGTFNQGGLDLGSTGASTSSGDRINTNFISVQPSTTYTISNHNSNIYQFGLGFYKSDETYDSAHKINNGQCVNFPYTFTTQSDTYYIRIAFKNSSSTAISPTGDYKIMLEQGSKANAYTPYGTTPIELCKIGNYQDYFYKSGSKWYLHKEVGKVVLDDDNEGWRLSASYSNNTRFSSASSKTLLGINSKLITNCFIEGEGGTDTTNIDTNGSTGYIMITIPNSIANTLDSFKNWLSNNNVIVYYSLVNTTDTEITGTLKEQLEAIYNAPLYEETNITQENNDLPMVLDITACKDNINGIKAFIRK